MSEEIIIDGVNVSECRFLDEWKHCDICEKLCDSKCLIVEDIECKTYDDCYYKRLKRLQEENEGLKKELWQLQHRKMWNKEATLQAELLIKENEKLKKEIKENLHYLACMTEQRNKLKLALEEIRAICKKETSHYDRLIEIVTKVGEVLK